MDPPEPPGRVGSMPKTPRRLVRRRLVVEELERRELLNAAAGSAGVPWESGLQWNTTQLADFTGSGKQVTLTHAVWGDWSIGPSTTVAARFAPLAAFTLNPVV